MTFDEFLDYYNQISSCIEDDKVFTVLIRGAWNLDVTLKPTGYRTDK